MDVYLVRHAIAHERNHSRWPNDALRPLTAAGKRSFRKSAPGLGELLPRNTMLLTSPYVRARATAEILRERLKLGKPVECAELGADQPVSAALRLIKAQKRKSVALVGHEPNLGRLLAAAIAGEKSRMNLEFKKGGVACLVFDRGVAAGRATLRWFLPPRLLRKIR